MEIQVRRDRLTAFAKSFPQRHRRAAISALRSEAYRILTHALRPYARTWGQGRWRRGIAPITRATRKGRGYGPWIARFSRYHLDPERLEARIGLLGKLPGARFQSISRQFQETARMHVKGYAAYVSPKRQRQLARIAQKRRKRFHALVPRVGWHFVRPRPFAGPVMRREKSRAVRNIARLYGAKMAGERYSRDWMAEWGNA